MRGDDGDGIDTAVYSGKYADYTITANRVTDNVGDDGSDTFYTVEFLEFDDGVYEIATQTFTSLIPPDHELTC